MKQISVHQSLDINSIFTRAVVSLFADRDFALYSVDYSVNCKIVMIGYVLHIPYITYICSLGDESDTVHNMCCHCA